MKINKILLSAFALGVLSLSTLVSCEDDSATDYQVHGNYVSLMNLPAPVEILEGETSTVQGKVYAATESGSDRVVTLEVVRDYPLNADGTINANNTTMEDADFTIPTTVTIPAGAREVSFPVTFTNNSFGFSGKRLSIRIRQEPGMEVAMTYTGTKEAGTLKTYSRPVIINARTACDENLLTVNISTDNFGSETSWELYTSDFSQLVASGGPYADGQIGGGETSSFCLPDGDYVFYILDSYGDGMNSGSGVGSYTLTKRGADGAQVQIATGGTFTDFVEIPFSLP